MGTLIQKETDLEGIIADVVDDLQQIIDALQKKVLAPKPKAVPSFEELLKNDLAEFVRNNPQAMYAALCNVVWKHPETGQEYPILCHWRYAGGLVAEIEDAGGDYMDYYCSGFLRGNVPEGTVTPAVAEALAAHGWKPEVYYTHS